MKIHFLKIKNWILACVAGVIWGSFSICFTSCRMAYGTPEADYKVKGTVRDPQGNPIEGIEVSMAYRSSVTDDEGKYSITVRYDAWSSHLTVRFSDIDSTENGLYADTTVVVDYSNANFTGGHGEWYEGTATREVDMTMRPIIDK